MSPDATTGVTLEELAAKLVALEADHAALASTLARRALEEDGSPAPSWLATDDADAFWLLWGMTLVFFMQTGFAMLEVGSVSSKNTKNILIKNIFDAAFAALFWWATGFAFAFGSDAFTSANGGTGLNGFVGGSGFFYEGNGQGDDASPLTNTPFAKTYGKAFWLFQWAFAGAAATIVSGAVAERCKFVAYVMFSCACTGFVYPCVAHMGWSEDGKFSPYRDTRLVGGCGAIDFAGSGVVHLTGGTAAVWAASIVGPRIGRFDSVKFEQQSVVQQTLGVLILWVGWYGFNGVSTLAIAGSGGVAAHTMMTTTISAATGCISTTLFGSIVDGAVDTAYANNGILAGLVSITAGCATSNLWGAFFTGLVAGPVYVGAHKLLIRLRIDDVVDAFPVHGCCGAWGVIAAAFFATEFYYARAFGAGHERAEECQGVFYGGDGGALGAAILFVLTIIAWVSACTVVIFTALKFTVGVRVSASAELAGLDNYKSYGNRWDLFKETGAEQPDVVVEAAAEEETKAT